MKRSVLLLALFPLAACATAPQPLPAGVTEANLTSYRAAVAGAGCAIETVDQAAPVETQTGFGADKLADITDYLTVTGEIEFTDRGIRLTSGSCANA